MDFKPHESFALKLDSEDPLSKFRHSFYIPEGSIYLDGNSLGLLSKDSEKSALQFLDGSTLCVFEDTPGGMVSAQEAANFLRDLGIRIEVKKIGIANEAAKQEALSAQKASVYADINTALASLDYF